MVAVVWWSDGVSGNKESPHINSLMDEHSSIDGGLVEGYVE
jgi:hypothetical protein